MAERLELNENGLEKVTGGYIYVDTGAGTVTNTSDGMVYTISSEVDPNYLEKLVNEMISSKSGITFCGIIQILKENNLII